MSAPQRASTDQQVGRPPEPSPAAQDFEDFIYLISHDVRSSVRALLELPQWIVEDIEEAGIEITGQLASSIDMMNRHTGRLDRMLVDLLTFSRIGRMQALRSVNIETALNDVLEQVKPPSGFHIVTALDVVEINIGDRDILTLLQSLVRNATMHHDRPSGQIIVSTALKGEFVFLNVVDDGPGIEPEFRERVFAAMTTLRPRDEVEGSGMGLANVRKIARLYGGDVQVLPSDYGRGTNFEVRLLRHPPPLKEDG